MYNNLYNYQRNGNQPEIREKLERYGIDIMSVQELVMLILSPMLYVIYIVIVGLLYFFFNFI